MKMDTRFRGHDNLLIVIPAILPRRHHAAKAMMAEAVRQESSIVLEFNNKCEKSPTLDMKFFVIFILSV